MNTTTNNSSYQSVIINGKIYTAFMIDERTAVFFGGRIPKLKTENAITEDMLVKHILKNN